MAAGGSKTDMAAAGGSKTPLIIGIIIVLVIIAAAAFFLSHQSPGVQPLSASISQLSQNLNVTDVATLTASASGGQQPYYFQWYNDTTGTAVPISGQTGVSLLVSGSASGTYKYYVSVSDSESPAKTVSSAVSSINVVVPSLVVSVSPQANQAYVGQSVTLAATASHGVPPYTYQWYNDTSGTGVPISGQTGAALTITPSAAGEYKYYISATDSETPAKTVYSPTVALAVNSTLVVHVTVTNSQQSPTPAAFQQMITFNPSTYASREAQNLGNIRFYEGSTELYSWCESGCTSSSQDAVFWVRLPNAIGPDSSANLNMEFLPSASNYDGVYAGEAPQLSPTYAQYDNGGMVFSVYQNFAGTSVPPGWSTAGSMLITFNNGVTYRASDTEGIVYTQSNYDVGAVDLYITNMSIIPQQYDFGTGFMTNLYNVGQGTDGFGSSSYLGRIQIASGDQGGVNSYQMYQSSMYQSSTMLTNASAGSTVDGIYTFMWPAMGQESYYFDYVNVLSSADTSISRPSGVYLGGGITSAPTSTVTVQWIRGRAAPPNGVMPTVSLSSA